LLGIDPERMESDFNLTGRLVGGAAEGTLFKFEQSSFVAACCRNVSSDLTCRWTRP
jgi:hypothetical protein